LTLADGFLVNAFDIFGCFAQVVIGTNRDDWLRLCTEMQLDFDNYKTTSLGHRRKQPGLLDSELSGNQWRKTVFGHYSPIYKAGRYFSGTHI
jgi:hypothetical protein